jgi:hypothetical protein
MYLESNDYIPKISLMIIKFSYGTSNASLNINNLLLASLNPLKY